MVAAIASGVGEGPEPGPWEIINEHGEIECLLMTPPTARARAVFKE
jgi:hypothetical protein